MWNPDYDYHFKFSLQGDSGVGKSCLLLRYAENTFTEGYISTIGVDFKCQDITLAGKRICTQVWDTAGQERFRTIKSNYDGGHHAFLLVFDLTDLTTFHSTQRWLQENSAICEGKSVVLIGTKSDLETRKVVEQDLIDAFVDKNKIIKCYKATSAKTPRNVQEVFLEAAKAVYYQLNPEVHSHDTKRAQHQKTTRASLVSSLSTYISNIESHKKASAPTEIDFSFDFLVLASSRGLNREANYLLAKSLLNKLQTTNQSIEKVFENIEQQRTELIDYHKLHLRPDFTNRGINDDKLNEIINLARKYIIGEHQLKKSQPGSALG